ncbi:MAG: hypothetical protein AAGB22_08875 [Bacteroidota bacterium]
MKKLLLCLMGAALLASCSDDDGGADNAIPDNPVDLSSLRSGQASYYVQYTSNCASLEQDFRFTGDTVVLEVFERGGSTWLRERYTCNSLTPSMWGAPITEELLRIHETQITAREDYVLVHNRPGSVLFYFYDNDTIWLNPQHDIQLEQTGCKLRTGNTIFIGNDIGQVDQFQVGPLAINNKTAVSCVPVILNLDGYLIYNTKHLYMSHTSSQSGWGPGGPGGEEFVSGWVMVE